ncbi:hypothetical protein PISL3812_00069 [Talaromyces islandicus]|uniref:Uncharacterized protein n=1 Tax=Talaromyces islandicus TaxID=28573 RepID=A0A0U1LI85_TALIS|nr:hypothetical protein PISL3812_00069 [Talaromyces islandicus]
MADNTLYLYTSLTAGSSHIITATSRLETILKANKIPFRAIDVATDDAARRLWGRYSKGRKLPGLVKYRTIIGDLEQIEEWNEFGELKMEIGAVTDPDDFSSKPATTKPAAPVVETPKPAATASGPKSASPHIQIQNPPVIETKEDQRTLALRLAGEEAAARAKQNALAKLGTKPATTEGDGKAAPTTDPSAKGTESVDTAAEKAESASEVKPSTPTSASQGETKQSSTPPPSGGRRTSVAPEIVPPLQRPSLADETAAVSTANFRAENADVLGLIDHHRGSIVSVTDKDEGEQVRKEIRASVTEEPKDGDIEALRKEDAAKKKQEAINEDEEEDTAVSGESEKETEEPVKAETEKKTKSPVAAEKEKEEEKEVETEKDEEEEKVPQEQDPKDTSEAGVSVED